MFEEALADKKRGRWVVFVGAQKPKAADTKGSHHSPQFSNKKKSKLLFLRFLY